MGKVKAYPNMEQFNPSECISAKVMKCNRIVANVFRKHLAQFHITDSQLSILFYISKAQNPNQKQIADFLYLEKSTVNRNISRLLEQQVISFNPSKELTLTDQGKRLVNQVIPHWEKAMAEIREILQQDGEKALNLFTQQLTR